MEDKAYNDLANNESLLDQNQSEEKRLRNKTSATNSDIERSIKNS
jgi:hypothetical protein